MCQRVKSLKLISIIATLLYLCGPALGLTIDNTADDTANSTVTSGLQFTVNLLVETFDDGPVNLVGETFLVVETVDEEDNFLPEFSNLENFYLASQEVSYQCEQYVHGSGVGCQLLELGGQTGGLMLEGDSIPLEPGVFSGSAATVDATTLVSSGVNIDETSVFSAEANVLRDITRCIETNSVCQFDAFAGTHSAPSAATGFTEDGFLTEDILRGPVEKAAYAT